MAFHVSCPLTCRRICDCELGFPEGLRSERARERFLDEVEAIEDFLSDPWSLREEATVQVLVPRVVTSAAAVDGGNGEDRAKRAALQREAVEASAAAEDYVRKLETGENDIDLVGEVNGGDGREEQGLSGVKVICRICFSGENEGSAKALKMLGCKTCDKKYHRSCLKSWAEYRDLFDWGSWACPSCRICEVCRRAGEPNKLMFCKRCDGAFHCYCQQPPHKNVSHGPYLCSKHTKCHSCGSTVPGNGPSTRWFLGYTCCDACGRLFVKGNYCPVCLKVYRDSETTPMVCCDICERWIHCACDGISDEKYQQFQVDQNLQYTCAACRGDCYQVKDTEDAVRELWKRKDETDHKLIASLRASAGLLSQDELVPVSPYSDDEQSVPKNDFGRSLKFSVKGLSNIAIKNSKESGDSISKNVSPSKNHTKKTIKFVGVKGSYQKNEERSLANTSKNQSYVDMSTQKPVGTPSLQSSVGRSPYDEGEKSSLYQVESNTTSVKEFSVDNEDWLSKVETERSKLQGLRFKQHTAKTEHKNETAKGTKLVIHLGSRNINVSSPPKSETSSCQREQDFSTSYGNEDSVQQKTKDWGNHMHTARGGIVKCDAKGPKPDNARLSKGSKHGKRERNFIKLGRVLSDNNVNENGNMTGDRKTAGALRPESDDDDDDVDVDDDVVLVKKEKQTTRPTNAKLQNDGGHHTSRLKFVSSAASDDAKPLLKLKFKNPYFEQRSSWAPRGEEENPIKGQRSKRKRPSTTEKVGADGGEEDGLATHNLAIPITDKEMDANWILQKLGKDAIGKRVEVHQSSDNSWCEGVVSDVTIQGGSTSSASLLVLLDNGRSTTLDLRKQAVRFASQKQKKRAKVRS